MRTSILTVNRIEGYHRTDNAPKYLNYLTQTHRHIFVVECGFTPQHEGAAVDNIAMMHQIDAYFRDRYGDPAQFGNRTCYQIARELLDFYQHCQYAIVREDGEGGGAAYRGCL